MVRSKRVFWQALVFTIVVFIIGLVMGFFLENSRETSVELDLLASEISLLDEQVRNRGIGQFGISCDLARVGTFAFADEIYGEAVRLDKYDATSKFSGDSLKELHKRYDLLRMFLWIEGIQLKEQCPGDFHTVVYLFEYASDEISVKAQQASMSRLLVDLKNKHGSDILLIPIAGNLNLQSVDMVKERYGVISLPAIIVDEREIFLGIPTFNELEDEVLFGVGGSLISEDPEFSPDVDVLGRQPPIVI